MSWERYLEALNGSMDTVMNTGFRLYEQGIVTSWDSVHTMTSDCRSGWSLYETFKVRLLP